jgi:hypothetical protein
MRDRIEFVVVQGCFFLLAYLLLVATLGFVRLTPICEVREHEIALRNIWSHFKWHETRGDWRR